MGATSPERHREVVVTPFQSDLTRATPRCRSRHHHPERCDRSDTARSLAKSIYVAFTCIGSNDFKCLVKSTTLHLSSLCTSQKDLYASSLENSSWNLLIAETQSLKPTTTLFELNELYASCSWSLVY
ncbi:hypothetical protein DY000_02056126 [Brassica cretica]|uniref:Uncharacterized protein n=1 Tax=Brassica cretica TaxID=69181 RepID=A0ABQ7AD07_BRACR|nr:hypothetical protein DY000_02056126 [Brassica cretica]